MKNFRIPHYGNKLYAQAIVHELTRMGCPYYERDTWDTWDPWESSLSDPSWSHFCKSSYGATSTMTGHHSIAPELTFKELTEMQPENTTIRVTMQDLHDKYGCEVEIIENEENK